MRFVIGMTLGLIGFCVFAAVFVGLFWLSIETIIAAQGLAATLASVTLVPASALISLLSGLVFLIPACMVLDE